MVGIAYFKSFRNLLDYFLNIPWSRKPYKTIVLIIHAYQII